MKTNERIIKLRNIYGYVRKVSCQSRGEKYEGVPLSSNWQSFDDFVKDNWIRYYRALIKWRNYKSVTSKEKNPRKLKNNYVRFKRKIKSRGYSKDNTVFTSPSDMMKYAEYTHKYMFEDRLLGTRDIKNILLKRGINITMEAITDRLKAEKNIFDPKTSKHIKWKGKFRNFIEIAEIENVNYDILKAAFYRKNDIRKAIDTARNTKKSKKYNFEGQELSQIKILEILHSRTDIEIKLLRSRFKKHGLNIQKLSARKNYKGYSKAAKRIMLEKNGKKQIFNSISDAARELNLKMSLISRVLNGQNSQTGGYRIHEIK